MTSSVSGLQLDLDLDDLPWVIGPTEQRPFKQWLPAAVLLMSQIFDVRQRKERKYVTAMLERIGRPDRGPLPYKLIRWLELGEVPLVASFGMVERGTPELLEAFLAAADSGPVERPVIEDVPAPAGVIVRRSLSYSQPDAGLFVEARYVIDNGHPAAVALLHAGERSPGAVVSALDDLDALALRMHVVGER
ncbi:MAG TPA: hypothetical protein VFG72_06105 [Marmoricola sp.]|nr:hypothetical protein [Marmoricola sp.]